MTPLSGMQRQRKRSETAFAFDLSVRSRRPAPEVFALLADIQDAEPLPRRAVIAPPLRRHVAERLDDIRAHVESGT